jgi:hypothetical protein
MSYCHINYIPQTTSFNSSTVEYKTPYNTFFSDGSSLNLIAQKSVSNLAEIFIITIIDGIEQEYNLNNTTTFNQTMAFCIKVIFNGTTESFNVNIINTDCDTIFYPLSLQYES